MTVIEMIRRYEAGFSLRQIARKAGIRHKRSVRQRLAAAGVRIRPQGGDNRSRPLAPRNRQIAQERLDGALLREIGKRHGLTIQSVSRICRQELGARCRVAGAG